MTFLILFLTIFILVNTPYSLTSPLLYSFILVYLSNPQGIANLISSMFLFASDHNVGKDAQGDTSLAGDAAESEDTSGSSPSEGTNPPSNYNTYRELAPIPDQWDEEFSLYPTTIDNIMEP